jgi:hypothetical protein
MSTPEETLRRKEEFYRKYGTAILQEVIKSRLPANDTGISNIFVKNCRKGYSKYLSAMRGNKGKHAKRQAFNTYQNLKVNIKYLEDNPRVLSKKKPLYDLKAVNRYLRRTNHLLKSKITRVVEPWGIPVGTPTKYSIGEVIEIVEREWDVKFTRHPSQFSDFYKFTISSSKSCRRLRSNYHHRGTVWINKTFNIAVDRDISTPVGVRDTVVFAPFTEKMIHEITHAIQNAFTPYWELCRENREVATMMIERKYGQGFGNIFTSRNVCIAIADLESSDAKDFDKIYAEECPINKPGLITPRLPHYYLYPRSYYSYVLGMTLPITLHPDLVRSDQAVTDLVNRYL